MSRNKHLPADPTDFGDLPPLQRAPDEVGAPSPDEPPPVVEPEPPPPIPVRPSIVLTADELVAAIRSGNAAGLPEVLPGTGERPNGTQVDLQVEAYGSSVYLGQRSEEVTCAIGGHAVVCTIETRVYISRWSVQGSREELSGKFRLLNDVTIAVRGVGMQTFKKNSEFFPHQVPFDDIKAAGGVLIPL